MSATAPTMPLQPQSPILPASRIFRMAVNVATHTYSVYVTRQVDRKSCWGAITLPHRTGRRHQSEQLGAVRPGRRCNSLQLRGASTDTTRPTIAAANFVYQVSPNQLTATFSGTCRRPLDKRAAGRQCCQRSNRERDGFQLQLGDQHPTFSLARPGGWTTCDAGCCDSQRCRGNHLRRIYI